MGCLVVKTVSPLTLGHTYGLCNRCGDLDSLQLSAALDCQTEKQTGVFDQPRYRLKVIFLSTYCLILGSHEAIGRLGEAGLGRGPSNMLHHESLNEGEALAQHQTSMRKSHTHTVGAVIQTGELEKT